MSSMNKVILLGNLTRDPDLRYTPKGAAACGFGLAINTRYTTQAGEERDEVCFVDIDVFGRSGENAGKYLKKGSPVLIEGRLRLEQWDDRQTGQKRTRLKVLAEKVQFIGGGHRQDGAQASQPQPRQAPVQEQLPIPEPPPINDDTIPF